jgi:high-affinity Fe2+/Pb2+ permease
MKGVAKFFIRWLVAYVAGAGLGVLIIGLGIRFFEDNEGLLIFIIIVGLIVVFLWIRIAVGLVNRWLERW